MWGLLSSKGGMEACHMLTVRQTKPISLLPLVATAVNFLIATLKPWKVFISLLKTSPFGQLKEVTCGI